MKELGIKIENISKRYQINNAYSSSLRETLGGLLTKKDTSEFWALKAISCEIEKGEVVGLIGKNGAGKSTLLKILSKITYPTKGKVEISGKVSSLLEVGTGFHPELTGKENIYLNGSILGMTREEIRISFDEIVDFAGVGQFLEIPVKRYSSGMYVRLAFSVAAHLRSDVLLVDEVLAVGDIEFQNKSFKYLRDEGIKNKTVILVSHNMESIKRLCKKAIYIKEGKISCFDKTEIAISKYLSDNTMREEKFHSKYIKSVEITGPSQENKIYSHKELFVNVKFNRFEEKIPRYIRLEFYNKWKNYLFLCNNRIKKEPLKPNTEKVIFKINSLPLFTDRYFIKIYLADEFGFVENVDQYFSFFVESSGEWEPQKKIGINPMYECNIR